MQVSAGSDWRRVALLMASIVASVWSGLRTYGSFRLLRSAYDIGMPQSGSIRDRMTLHYLAAAYRVPEPLLIARLGIPADTPPETAPKRLTQTNQPPRNPGQFTLFNERRRNEAELKRAEEHQCMLVAELNHRV
jgi:hypothetical protein